MAMCLVSLLSIVWCKICLYTLFVSLHQRIFRHQLARIYSYSPKDMIPAAWTAFAFANTHASSVGRLENTIKNMKKCQFVTELLAFTFKREHSNQKLFVYTFEVLMWQLWWSQWWGWPGSAPSTARTPANMHGCLTALIHACSSSDIPSPASLRFCTVTEAAWTQPSTVRSQSGARRGCGLDPLQHKGSKVLTHVD